MRLGILRPPPALCKAASKAVLAIEAVLPPGTCSLKYPLCRKLSFVSSLSIRCYLAQLLGCMHPPSGINISCRCMIEPLWPSSVSMKICIFVCPGFKPHATAPESMHITIFMTSQPADPRPDPFNEFGGGQSRTLAEGRIPAPKPEVLAAEKDAFRTLAAQTSAPILEVKHQLLHPDRRGDC